MFYKKFISEEKKLRIICTYFQGSCNHRYIHYTQDYKNNSFQEMPMDRCLVSLQNQTERMSKIVYFIQYNLHRDFSFTLLNWKLLFISYSLNFKFKDIKFSYKQLLRREILMFQMLTLAMLNISLYFETEIFILSLNKVTTIWPFLLIKIE